MQKAKTSKNIWTEDWGERKVILWKDNPAHPSARVFMAVEPEDTDEVADLIQKIDSLRMDGGVKTSRQLREIYFSSLRSTVRLGQISKQLDAVSLEEN